MKKKDVQSNVESAGAEEEREGAAAERLNVGSWETLWERL